MTPEIKDALEQLLSTLILAALGLISTVVLPYLVLLARSWVNARVARIKDEQIKADIEHAMQRLEQITSAVVSEINQTAKQYGHDGKLDADERKRLKVLAYQRVKAQLPGYLNDTLHTAIADVNRYIVTKIEQQVARQKVDECKPSSG